MRIDRQPADQGRVERLGLLDVPKELRAGQEVISWLLRRGELLLVKQTEHPLDLADQHILFVPELGVKGGAADIGPVDDLLHRDPVVALLAHQPEQGFDNEPAAAPRPSIWSSPAEPSVVLPNNRAVLFRIGHSRQIDH